MYNVLTFCDTDNGHYIPEVLYDWEICLHFMVIFVLFLLL